VKSFFVVLSLAACVSFGHARTARAATLPVTVSLLIQSPTAMLMESQAAEPLFSDPMTPTCDVLAARLNFKNKQLEQIQWLLKNRPNDFDELTALIQRYMKLQQELQEQYVTLRARFDWPAYMAKDLSAVAEKKYRLSVEMPGLTWVSLDDKTPFAVRLSPDDQGYLTIEADWNLLDFCFSRPHIFIRLDL
jgi:hypothetical protein